MKRKLKRYTPVAVKSEYSGFGGGLVDDKTPIMLIPPGHARRSLNVVERFNGGYEVAPAYERYDGRYSPSRAVYASLAATISGSVSPGDTITDAGGSASGVLLAVADDYIVLTKVQGQFATGDIKVGSTVVGTCTGPQRSSYAPTRYLNAKYRALAADEYRTDIQAIPGSGPVRGVWQYKDVRYGFRDNVAGSKCEMYKTTESGWELVNLGYELDFSSGGTFEVQEGDTIVGATSGATAVVTRVVLEDGLFSSGDAAGRFIFAAQTGTFQNENVNVGGNTDVATISGPAQAIEFSVPGGRFEFINTNFTGAITTKRMYGCDGKNRGFEFDGSVFVPLNTGMTQDTPEHVYEHHKQLFFSFGGWIQHCSPGFPYQWSVVVNAGGLAMGDVVTGFAKQPGSETHATLCIADRNSLAMLYGTGKDNWQLIGYKDNAGAIPWTIQRIGRTYMFDDRGITELRTTQEYGNFKDATVSQKVNEWLKTKKGQVTASCIFMEKNQYWLFFRDKTALCCTVDNGAMKSFMPCRFEHRVECIFSLEDEAGTEITMFGDENGYVHQMFQGTSFDGEMLEWYFDLAFDPLKSPMTTKKYRMGRFEVEGDGYAEFQFSYSLEYESPEMQSPLPVTSVMSLEAATWDSGTTWDTGRWDGKSLSPRDFEIKGSGVNISLKFKGRSNMFAPLVFPGAFIQFTPTRDIR